MDGRGLDLLRDMSEGWSDVFGDGVTKGTRNLLDIASHYEFSPERLRLYRNGSREYPQYNTVAQFSDNADHWLLSPDAGDTMRIESAESGTYVVNYELRASWAFQLTQSLSAGDVLRFGPRNTTDGWFIEQRGADHDDHHADIKQLANGVETTLRSDVNLHAPTTEWYRRAVDFGWYAALRQSWTTSVVTEDDDIDERVIAKSATAGNRGPETGNLNLWVELEADASTSGLGLEVGSMGMITIGNPTGLNRDKPQFESLTLSGTADAWEPLLAIRIDPDNPNVNMQLASLKILSYAANATAELLAVSFDADKTDATGWGTPEYHHAANSALQSTTNVSQVARNSDGTVVDLDTTEKFGGFTMASSVDVDGGNVSGSESTANQNRQEKKAVLNSDVVVFLARSSTVGSALNFVWDVDQNW